MMRQKHFANSQRRGHGLAQAKDLYYVCCCAPNFLVESFVIGQELDDEVQLEASKKFLFASDESEHAVDPVTQARLEALLEAAGIGKLSSGDGKHLSDPEVLRRLTSSVSCALDEAAAALTRMRNENQRPQQETRSLVEACSDGDVGTVKKLLTEGRSVHETTEEGESLLSLACSAGYYELAQVLLAMNANVEDRGIKGDCTPLMEAASAGHVDIVKLLINHGADVNAQSSSGNTPLMYGCAGGYSEVVKVMLEAGANVEDHNENGHTPLMEAASAGKVAVAKVLLDHGAGINTHSNEFKESALTLACYKGHLDMVRFLLEEGADQEHKTDEMHTALMEASMDGHVEVAKLLLDSGAQVNMPTDSFESPLTLAACGGHVDLAMLLIERGANIEEVNDEGYTPLMEAAREGHEEMVALLLSQGANINAQTEETQETALTLACCGGFLEVADFLLKAGADLELGSSTPLMEAAQEGHLELVKYLLDQNANVTAQTQTGDTALTYACENGHTDVADLLLQYGSDLEHESEGGRTPLMKACRAGHQCTVKFLIQKGADVNRQSTNNDHTPLSLASAGGHLAVVQLLLQHNADPFHKLKDNSTMLIEAAKGGHTKVVQLLLDYPHSIMMGGQQAQSPQAGTTTPQPPTQLQTQSQPGTHSQPQSQPQPSTLVQAQTQTQPSCHPASPEQVQQAQLHHQRHAVQQAGLIAVPDAVQALPQEEVSPAPVLNVSSSSKTSHPTCSDPSVSPLVAGGSPEAPDFSKKSVLRKNRAAAAAEGNVLTSAEAQQTKNVPPGEGGAALSKEESNILDKGSTEQLLRQQIYADLQRVEEEQEKQVHLAAFDAGFAAGAAAAEASSNVLSLATSFSATPPEPQPSLSTRKGAGSSQGSTSGTSLPTNQLQVLQPQAETQSTSSSTTTPATSNPAAIYLPPPPSTPPQTVTTSAEVNQSTAISDRPKAKPATKKETKLRKQQIVHAVTQELAFQAAQMAQMGQNSRICAATAAAAVNLAQINNQQQLEQRVQTLDQEALQRHQQLHLHHQLPPGGPVDPAAVDKVAAGGILTPNQLIAHLQQLDPSITAATPQQLHHHVHQVLHQKPNLRTLQQMLPGGPDDLAELLSEQVDQGTLDRENLASAVVDSLEALQALALDDITVTTDTEEHFQPYGPTPSLGEAISAMAAAQVQGDLSHVEYYAVPATGAQHPALQVRDTEGDEQLQYQQYQLTTGNAPCSLEVIANATNAQILANRAAATAGAASTTSSTIPTAFQPQLLLPSPQLASPSSDSSTPTLPVPASSAAVATQAESIPVPPPLPTPASKSSSTAAPPSSAATAATAAVQTSTPTACTQPHHHHGTPCSSHQVQASTQTTNAGVTAPLSSEKKVLTVSQTNAGTKGRKARYQVQARQQQASQLQPLQQSASAQQQGVAHHDANTAAGQYTTPCAQAPVSSLNVDSETESNHDTALTLACAGGHDELVELLLSRGSDIEHRDKKGFTPLILAATAGHHKVVEILLDHGADIEAQSERTKDTPLSLACSGGRYEVVDLLLQRGANKEHRNVSDYTPLSLAASGGYVNIIKLLLAHGAEINSRTGSKLGISPLMLAAMNGHTAAVKLLLDMGSDINAQIETNRNTALTLACFQGRHEVVSLLLDRKANVEHRAKTGLTPLMEAASGGYVEVGRVLLDKGADVNAPPVPSSRDTGLTIAADKGHCRFVELLLTRGAQVEVKNKKGNSPLWLAANGGHLNVVELLFNAGADIDSQDNRKVSCLMSAFRKGHIKVVKWMVHHVMQFPSDQEMTRYVATISDKELLDKCQDCIKIIRAAKDQQAAKANKNASILLEELDQEKTREETKRLAAQRRRDRKKKKKQEKRKQLSSSNENDDDDNDDKDEESDKEFSGSETCNAPEESPDRVAPVATETVDKEEGDSGIDANSQGSCSSSDVKSKDRRKDKKKKTTNGRSNLSINLKSEKENSPPDTTPANSRVAPPPTVNSRFPEERTVERRTAIPSTASTTITSTTTTATSRSIQERQERKLKSENKAPNPVYSLHAYETTSRHPAEREDFEATGNETYTPVSKTKKVSQLYNCGDVGRYESETTIVGKAASSTSPKQGGKREEGWKEVVRKYSPSVPNTYPQNSSSHFRSKKVSVPLNAISRVIGRGGSNINAIRAATGAQIEVEKQCKGQGERIITIKGCADATRQAHMLIATLIKDPDVDIMGMLPKPIKSGATVGQWEKPAPTALKVKPASTPVSVKPAAVPTVAPTPLLGSTPSLTKIVPSPGANSLLPALRSAAVCKLMSSYSPPVTRGTAPRLVAAAEKRAAILAAANTKTTMSYTSAIMTSGRNAGKGHAPLATQTFAAKLSEPTTGVVAPASSASSAVPTKSRQPPTQPPATAPATPLVSTVPSPKHHRPPPISSAPPNMTTHLRSSLAHTSVNSTAAAPGAAVTLANSARSSSPAHAAHAQPMAPASNELDTATSSTATPLTYSLFNSDKTMWSRDSDGNSTQKGMNFASVAAAGSASANASHASLPPTQYLDSTPPQVDISKAPGYRKNTTCSPTSVSSKPCSTASSPPSLGPAEAGTLGSANAMPSPVKPPNLLALSRPGAHPHAHQHAHPHVNTDMPPTSAGQGQGQSGPQGQPSPIMRHGHAGHAPHGHAGHGLGHGPNLEIQPPDLGLSVGHGRQPEMQPSPNSGLAVQRPNKDQQGPLGPHAAHNQLGHGQHGPQGQQPLASPSQHIPLPHRQSSPPHGQLQMPPTPMGSALTVQRPSMQDMQHSPSRSNSSVDMQAMSPSPQANAHQAQQQAQQGQQAPQGPPPNTSIPPPGHGQGHGHGMGPSHGHGPHGPHGHHGPPGHNHMMRPMSMEIPHNSSLNHNMVVRPNSMVDVSQNPSQPQPPGPGQSGQPQRLDLGPSDYGVRSHAPVFPDDNSGLYSNSGPDALLGMVPGMTDMLNTAVSMSRLNPRAPDFSSAMHHTNKPPPHPPMFQSAPPYLPPTMLGPPGPLPNKFHPPRPAPGHGPGPSHGPGHGPGQGPAGHGPGHGPGSSHNRWPFMPHGHHGYQPDAANFNVLGSLNHPSSDMMPPMAENGNSPPSPNHGHGHGHGPGGAGGALDTPMKAPPRPIGTERHLKHHSMGGDTVTGADWLLGLPNVNQPHQAHQGQAHGQAHGQADHKMSWAGPQMFRSNPPPYDLPPMDTFPLGMDNQFHNGGNTAAAAAAALLHHSHSIPMMNPNPYSSGGAGAFGADLGHDAMKMDASSWDGPNRLGMPELNDKQHGWTNKWSH
ncbi:ankyrin repeat domain-containing protein 17 isoform X2 [Thrips palmi]|uniref:Ankyrin repeat domain-containing protein 17 isoform X2 n=1 Tax=Thrips palmi TaxID=161013 RepID=A0A6P9A027_THRPL|nr:ankyrin repeat domain-containing protein 17 isoform X2 [Thrips palmi]